MTQHYQTIQSHNAAVDGANQGIDVDRLNTFAKVFGDSAECDQGRGNFLPIDTGAASIPLKQLADCCAGYSGRRAPGL